MTCRVQTTLLKKKTAAHQTRKQPDTEKYFVLDVKTNSGNMPLNCPGCDKKQASYIEVGNTARLLPNCRSLLKWDNPKTAFQLDTIIVL